VELLTTLGGISETPGISSANDKLPDNLYAFMIGIVCKMCRLLIVSSLTSHSRFAKPQSQSHRQSQNPNRHRNQSAN
jgi:hypothetical protein